MVHNLRHKLIGRCTLARVYLSTYIYWYFIKGHFLRRKGIGQEEEEKALRRGDLISMTFDQACIVLSK